MSRRRISSGSKFERDFAYSRAVVDDAYVFVSGTTGYNYETMTISADPAAQAEQCFLNIEVALNAAGSNLDEVVRVRYLITDRANVDACAPVFRRFLDGARPAATLIVTDLLDPAMKIEIEVTARLSQAPPAELTAVSE
jgi:enamine deaminase RidA (YjgF/YER057c/UK114 family)